MFFTTVTSVLALASFASAAAPSVIYPHQGTVWENTWFHNVTWAPQSGTGNIMLTHGGTMTTLINNVDLSTGRVVIQVPKSVMQAQDWIVQIAAGGDTSSSNAFAIGPPSAVAPGGGSSASSGAASATGSASVASSISASAGASAASSAASSLASSASSLASGSSVIESASSSVASDINSASASAASQFSSLINSASSAGASSLTSVLSAASASGASKISSVASSATAPAGSSGSSSGAAPLGFSMFGATVAAGLVAITTLSGALVL